MKEIRQRGGRTDRAYGEAGPGPDPQAAPQAAVFFRDHQAQQARVPQGLDIFLVQITLGVHVGGPFRQRGEDILHALHDGLLFRPVVFNQPFGG